MKTRISSAVNAGPIEGTGYNEYQRICQVLLDITEWADAHRVKPIIGLYQEDIPAPDVDDIYCKVNSLVIRGRMEYNGRNVYINYFEASDAWAVSVPTGRFLNIPVKEWDEKLEESYWTNTPSIYDDEEDHPVRKRIRK